MFCSKCGAQNDDNNVTCASCGTPLAHPEVQAIQPLHSVSASKYKNINIIGIVASAIFALGCLLPFAKASAFGMSVEKSLIDGSDWIYVLLVAVLALGLSILGQNIGLLVTGVLAGVLAFIESTAFSSGSASNLLSKGIGFYMLVIGAVLIFVAGIYGLAVKKKKK